MSVLQRIQAGIEQYCIEKNSLILSTALITSFHRTAGKFDIVHHLALFDQGNGEGCGCQYCLLLYEYSRANIRLHKFKKHYEGEFYEGPIKTLEEFYRQYYNRQTQCKKMRVELEKLSVQMRIPNAVKIKQTV